MKTRITGLRGTPISQGDIFPPGHFAPRHFAPNRTRFCKVDILPQLKNYGGHFALLLSDFEQLLRNFCETFERLLRDF